MNIRTALRLCSAIAGAVCLAVLAILVPEYLWTSDGIAAALVLSLSFAAPAFLTISALRSDATESARIWLIGPTGKLWALLVVVAATALRFSFVGFHGASWAASVIWCGLYVVGVTILSASARIVGRASSQTKTANTDARHRWTQLLLEVRSHAVSEDERGSIERLVDKIRFAANEPGYEPDENREIDTLLRTVKDSLGTPGEIVDLIRSTEVVLERREQTLRASRTRA